MHQKLSYTSHIRIRELPLFFFICEICAKDAEKNFNKMLFFSGALYFLRIPVTPD